MANASSIDSSQFEEEWRRVPGFHEACKFALDVKARFADDQHNYRAILRMFFMYRDGEKSLSEAFEEIICLLWEHPDLVDDFTSFFPPAWSNYGGQQENSVFSEDSCPYWSLPMLPYMLPTHPWKQPTHPEAGQSSKRKEEQLQRWRKGSFT